MGMFLKAMLAVAIAVAQLPPGLLAAPTSESQPFNASDPLLVARDSYQCFGGVTTSVARMKSFVPFHCRTLANIAQPLGGYFAWTTRDATFPYPTTFHDFKNQRSTPYTLNYDTCVARYYEIIDGCDYQSDNKHGGDHTYDDGTFFKTYNVLA